MYGQKMVEGCLRMSELARSRQVVFIGSKAAAVRRHEVKNEEIALKKKGTKLGGETIARRMGQENRRSSGRS